MTVSENGNSTHIIPGRSKDKKVATTSTADAEIRRANAVLTEVGDVIEEEANEVLSLMASSLESEKYATGDCLNAMVQGTLKNAVTCVEMVELATNAAATIAVDHPKLAVKLARVCVFVSRAAEDTAQLASAVLKTGMNQFPRERVKHARVARSAFKAASKALDSAKISLDKAADALRKTPSPVPLKVSQGVQLATQAYNAGVELNISAQNAANAAVTLVLPEISERELQKKMQLSQLNQDTKETQINGLIEGITAPPFTTDEPPGSC